MKRTLGLIVVSCVMVIGLSAATALAQAPEPPTPPAAPAAPAAPAVAAAAAIAPPVPAAPPAPQAPAPKPAAAPRPAAAPKPPEPPQPPEPARADVPGRERIETEPVNIRFEVTIGYQVGTAAPIKRTAVLTVANGSGLSGGLDRGMLRSGNNVPVPSTSFTPQPEGGRENSSVKPQVAFTYRSVGLNVDVQSAGVLPNNRVRASLNVEFSGVDERAGAGPSSAAMAGAPSFPTFSQRVSLYLENGKPVVVAQSSDFVDNAERRQTVEVKATILR